MTDPGTATADASEVPKRVVLRLDNGALIGPAASLGGHGDGVILVNPIDAVQQGRSGEKDADRLRSIHTELKIPVPSVNFGNDDPGLKRKPSTLIETNAPPKRPKMTPLPHEMNGAGHTSSPDAAPMSPSSSAPVAAPTNWMQKCQHILHVVHSSLGKHSYIFDKPVDGNVVVDYYKIIKHPMDLGTVFKKMRNREYPSHGEFAADVRLVWKNCQLYNKPETPVAKLGRQASDVFETEWAKSGLAEPTRTKRQNAGRAAAKYEPTLFEGRAPSHVSRGGSQKGSQPKQAPAPQDRQAGAQRGKSGEVTSAPPTSDTLPQMSSARKEALAVALMNNIDGTDHSTGAIEILRESGDIGDESDEVELDIDKLSNETLWELDRYLTKCLGGSYPPPEVLTENEGGGGIVIEQDSDDDEDSDFASG